MTRITRDDFDRRSQRAVEALIKADNDGPYGFDERLVFATMGLAEATLASAYATQLAAEEIAGELGSIHDILERVHTEVLG